MLHNEKRHLQLGKTRGCASLTTNTSRSVRGVEPALFPERGVVKEWKVVRVVLQLAQHDLGLLHQGLWGKWDGKYYREPKGLWGGGRLKYKNSRMCVFGI